MMICDWSGEKRAASMQKNDRQKEIIFVSLKKHLSSLSERFAEENEQEDSGEKPGTGMNRSAGAS